MSASIYAGVRIKVALHMGNLRPALLQTDELEGRAGQ